MAYTPFKDLQSWNFEGKNFKKIETWSGGTKVTFTNKTKAVKTLKALIKAVQNS